MSSSSCLLRLREARFCNTVSEHNFSVAVWIGYIALFGTAIQTGVVMVVYLEEALKRKQEEKGNAFGLQDLTSAVIEGAMLCLRPKVMTVGTVIASLLPIMWSTRTGAEVMRPLAAPIIVECSAASCMSSSSPPSFFTG